MNGYTVISTQPWIYTDATNQVVHGFRVFVNFGEYNETHELYVRSLSSNVVKTAAENLLKQRKDLSTM